MPSEPTNPTSLKFDLHVADRILIGLGIAGFLYFLYFIFTAGDENYIDLGAVLIQGLAALCVISGFYLVRQAESHRGDFALRELIGMALFGLGLIILVPGNYTQKAQEQIQDKIHPLKPLSDFPPPLVTVEEEKDSDKKLLHIRRLEKGENEPSRQVTDADKPTIIVHIEHPVSVGTGDIKPIEIPKEFHGKIWFKIEGNRQSRAQDF